MKMTRVIHNVNMSLRYFLFQDFYNSTILIYKCMIYTTDPDFQINLHFDFLDYSVTGTGYAYKNILHDKEAGPYRQIM